MKMEANKNYVCELNNVKNKVVTHLCVIVYCISEYIQINRMPKIRRSRKPPPEGWELIEPTLEVYIDSKTKLKL